MTDVGLLHIKVIVLESHRIITEGKKQVWGQNNVDLRVVWKVNFFSLDLVIGGPEDAPSGGDELILPGGRKPGAT